MKHLLLAIVAALTLAYQPVEAGPGGPKPSFQTRCFYGQYTGEDRDGINYAPLREMNYTLWCGASYANIDTVESNVIVFDGYAIDRDGGLVLGWTITAPGSASAANPWSVPATSHHFQDVGVIRLECVPRQEYMEIHSTITRYHRDIVTGEQTPLWRMIAQSAGYVGITDRCEIVPRLNEGGYLE